MEHTRLPFSFVTHPNPLLNGVKIADLPTLSSIAEWSMRALDGAATGKAPAPLLKTVISHGFASLCNRAGYGEK